mmetsp:Transcript_2963/g.5123  ORF Transcript_2963/g.5123 Transcript_2963/m.5123 type:complete len:245 (+) Transcript_2963:62-796(+)
MEIPNPLNLKHWEKSSPASVFGCIIMWSIISLITQISIPGKPFTFKTRLVSLLHAVVSSMLCFKFIAWGPFDFGGPNTPGQNLVMNVTGGYFIYDAIVSTTYEIIHKKVDIPMLVHHVVSISGCIWCFMENVSGAELALCTLLAEISNPFMHAVLTLEDLKMNGSILHPIFQGLFLLTYTIARIFISPYFLTWQTIISPKPTMMIKIEAFLMQAVSFLWFGKICMMVYETAFGKKKKDDNKKGK